MSSKLKVAVLFGGRSNEHSISVATAGGVLGKIDRNKYEVIPIGITPEGIFIPFDADPKDLLLSKGLKTLSFAGKSVRFELDGSRSLIQTNSDGTEENLGVIDVVFPLLHGPFGEDGTLQGYLEMVGVKYVGNGVLASAVAMDKEFSKALFKANGIPSPNYVVVTKNDMVNNPESALEKIKGLGSLPLFVKPARAGSSVGISKLGDLDDLPKALAYAFEHDDKVIIEQGVVGRELELGVLQGRGDQPLRVSVAGEITVVGKEFYDFSAKYLDSAAATLTTPANLTEAELSEMQQLARRAFRALGCRGLARVDFFLTGEGFLLSEINTMPGFTEISMFPRCFLASGLKYEELIDELIALALET